MSGATALDKKAFEATVDAFHAMQVISPSAADAFDKCHAEWPETAGECMHDYSAACLGLRSHTLLQPTCIWGTSSPGWFGEGV